jgi:hypothetical protein
VPLVTYANLFGEKDNITNKLASGAMPPPGSGKTISAADKSAILAWVAAGAVGVPYTNGVCP